MFGGATHGQPHLFPVMTRSRAAPSKASSSDHKTGIDAQSRAPVTTPPAPARGRKGRGPSGDKSEASVPSNSNRRPPAKGASRANSKQQAGRGTSTARALHNHGSEGDDEETESEDEDMRSGRRHSPTKDKSQSERGDNHSLPGASARGRSEAPPLNPLSSGSSAAGTQ